MLTSFIKFLIDPFNLLLLLLIFAIGAWILKKKRLGKWLVITSAIWFLLISTPLLPTLIVNTLEDRYTPLYTKELADLEDKYHIVLLGFGHGFDDRLPPNSLLSSQALGRLNEGIRLHRQLPNSNLVLSGSSSSGGTTQAEMLQQTALLLSKFRNIILQKEPDNTYREAQVYERKYGNNFYEYAGMLWYRLST